MNIKKTRKPRVKGEREETGFSYGLGFLALGILILAVQWAGLLDTTDNRLKDYHYQKGGLVSPDIYVIGIDEETLMEYGAWQSWSRRETAALIRLLNQDEATAPAVIGLDIGFFGAANEEDDRALAQAAALLDNVVVTSYLTFGTEVAEHENGAFVTKKGVATYEEPYEALREYTDWGFSNVPLDEDGIARHSLYRVSHGDKTMYSFACELYRKYTEELPASAMEREGRGYIPFSGLPFDYYGSETAGLSFSKVLKGEIPADMFAGSIVLVGPYSAGMMDSYYTPVSHDVPMFGVEIHANILQAFLDVNTKIELSAAMALVLTIAVTAAFFLFSKLKNMKAITLAAVFFITLYWFLTGYLYEKGYILPLFYPLGTAAVFYVYHIIRQYLYERRAKRRIEHIFGKYVSKEVASEIVRSGIDALKLGGQKKDIAVLFVDIRGFTPLSESLPPEKVVEILNRYLGLTTKAVFDNGGTVDKFIGDATMAVYNAPLDLDDYVFRAVKTGLDMARAAEDLEHELEQVTYKKVGFGIGINCGEAVIGNIGTAQRMDYTAIGNTVNTAARLESQAKAGQVIISQEVYDRLRGRIKAVSLGKRQLKGIRQEAEIYQVEGILPGREEP